MADKKIKALALALFLFLPPARADWQIASLQREGCEIPGAEYRRYSLGETEVQLAIFSSKNATLRVIDRRDPEDSLAAAMTREQAIAGVNGGYFDPEGAPVGLLRSKGEQIHPWQKARLLSGVIAVGSAGVKLYRGNEFPRKQSWREAIQCGPFLIDHGKPVPGLEKTRNARRTFFAITSDHRFALGFCDSVTLAQLAEIVAALTEIKITRALNLDGGSSSAFWCRTKEETISIAEHKSVRDFLAVVPSPSR